MKIYVLAIAILVFSGVVTIYNELNIFGVRGYEPQLTNISETEVTEIYKPTTGEGAGIIPNVITDALQIPGLLFKIMGMIWKFLGNAFNLGSVFMEYVPGVVGEQIGLLITTITWAVYLWGGVQLWFKVSSKSMD